MHVKLLSSEAFFQPKMQQISFSELCQDPLGELTALSRPQLDEGGIWYTTSELLLRKERLKYGFKNATNVLGTARTNWMSLQHGQTLRPRKKS